MGEPWAMVPDWDRCPHCGEEPEEGVCPNCNVAVPAPVSRLWPLYYLVALAALFAVLLPVLIKTQAAASPVITALLALMASAAFCSAFCVVYFIYTVRRGKDKRMLLRFILSNFATVIGSGILLVVVSLFL